MATRGFIVAGTASGVGKTTITAGICAALRSRGLRVQPFKAGPDYIDPTYLSRAAGNACRNLDTWMLEESGAIELYARAAANCDVTVIEGVMGLFDGRGDGTGSTAHLARLLGLPVILVVDARAMAESAAATVLGFERYDSRVPLAGVILNRVANAHHAALCAAAITERTGLPVFGAIPRDEAVAVPERHLGLVPDIESPAADEWFEGLSQLVARHVDLDALLVRAAATTAVIPASGLFPEQALPRTAAIAIAKDAAFHFYYQDSLDLLTAWGAALLPFSPLADGALPAGCGAVYIGGGFPELFATDLAHNVAMHEALRAAAARDLPIYGECGGLMYLGRGITGFEGQRHTMAGLVPAESVMKGTRLTLGYREVESLGTPLLPPGARMRGHEFHWSALEHPPEEDNAAYHVLDMDGRPDGFRSGSVTATYVHAHLGSQRGLASNFVAAAHSGKQTRAMA